MDSGCHRADVCRNADSSESNDVELDLDMPGASLKPVELGPVDDSWFVEAVHRASDAATRPAEAEEDEDEDEDAFSARPCILSARSPCMAESTHGVRASEVSVVAEDAILVAHDAEGRLVPGNCPVSTPG